jgi:hypothetical protein
MPIDKVFAHISCSDLEQSIPWYTKLFDRAPDASPMPGLAEWHQNQQAAFQLFQDPPNAGHATVTLGVSNLENERSRLEGLKLEPGAIERADYHRVAISASVWCAARTTASALMSNFL